MPAEPTIRSWSTNAVPPAMRCDYWISVVRSALWPVTDFSRFGSDFSVELQEASLGCITSTVETIGAHQARRTLRDVERTEERSYLLLSSFSSSWGMAHQGYEQRLRRGDIVLVGEGVHETRIPSGFHGVILKCPANWLHSWLPEPALLAGTNISRDSKWGRVLSPMISQLTPVLAAAPPLPHSVLTDQLGALLALAAGEAEARPIPGLLKRIEDCIRERCCEAQLTADDVAAALRVPPRYLHRSLATENLTFACALLNARISVALQMLGARSFDSLTISEIRQRAGFLSDSHFARVLRKRTGHGALELRRPRA